MKHVTTKKSVPSSAVTITFGCAAWAISLASECGARTAAPEEERERAIHARLEFPLTGGGKPTGLLAADLDGDGKSELIVLTSSPSTLQIWSGLSRVLLGWPDPRAVAVDDFTLGPVWFGGRAPNGKDDPAAIVYASRATCKVVVRDVRAAWKSQTDDQAPTTLEVTLPKRPRVLASGDFGGDGKLEIAVVTVDDNLVIIRGPNDVVTTKLGLEQATCAAFSDDGKHLYVGFQGSRKLVKYAVDVSGRAVVESETALPGLPRSILALPPRQQRLAGVLVAGGDDAVWLCAGEKLGIVATYAGGTVPYALVHGTLLGTERFVSIALQGQEIVAWDTQMSAAPIAATRTYAGQHPLAGAIGDFDGDGHNDLAIANGDAQRIGVLFATKANTFDAALNSKIGRSVNSLACGDMNGDKHLDVVTISALEGTLSISLQKTGLLQDSVVQGRADGGDSVRIADLDGDGANDVLFLKRRAEASTVIDAYFGDGQGHLVQRAEVRPMHVGVSAGDLLVTDLDGDGTLEALVTDPEGGRVVVVDLKRVKDAGLAFENPRGILVESGPKRLALVDVEGDAKAEIAVALAGPGKTLGAALLRVKKDNDGRLVLELIRVLPSTTPVTGVASADCNGDGLGDLVLLATKSDSDSHLAVHYQRADRSFVKADEEYATGARPYALRMADLDGDAIQDIVVTAQNSHHVNVWLNGGPPPAPENARTPIHFARIADFGVGTGPLDVQLADMDGDGQVEIVVANAFSNDISVVRVR
ncbi:MAG: VCBS repeat-containing protein [Planctomycetota bacterium]|mgnify:CR=1 FL=1|nr:VCBS repeat-containing protein [Planctomycetota bacterium]